MSVVFIAVEGPTGVGKTTLAARLATVLDATAMFDPFDANPFLPQLLSAEAMSAEPALRAELTFFALRVGQLRHVSAILATGRSVIADWASLKQPIFAATTLSAADAAQMTATCELWADGLPAPDLLVGLSASIPVLRSRVRRRGRQMESAITVTDLAALSAAFDNAYAQWRRPLIRVDASSFDVFDEGHLSELAAQVRQLLIPVETR